MPVEHLKSSGGAHDDPKSDDSQLLARIERVEGRLGRGCRMMFEKVMIQ